MKIILENYNEQTGCYDGFAIISEEGETKGSEENPFTGEDIGKVMNELEDKGLIKDGVAAIYVGRDENNVPEVLEESERFIRITHVE